MSEGSGLNQRRLSCLGHPRFAQVTCHEYLFRRRGTPRNRRHAAEHHPRLNHPWPLAAQHGRYTHQGKGPGLAIHGFEIGAARALGKRRQVDGAQEFVIGEVGFMSPLVYWQRE